MNPGKNILTIIFATTMAFVTSCNTIDYEKANAIARAGGASIQGLQFKDGGAKHVFSLIYIDGKPVEKPGIPMVYEIATGERSVGVLGEALVSWLGNSKSLGGQAEIKFTAKAGHKYEIRGTIANRKVTLYIFDLTDGKAVSDAVTAGTRAMEQRSILY